MKIFIILAACCVLLLSICLLGFNLYQPTGNISIAVRETQSQYKLNATFNRDKADKVALLVHHFLDMDSRAAIPDQPDTTVTLTDRTRFNIGYAPGKFRLTLDKRTSTKEGLARVKRLCDTLKEVIAGP